MRGTLELDNLVNMNKQLSLYLRDWSLSLNLWSIPVQHTEVFHLFEFANQLVASVASSPALEIPDFLSWTNAIAIIPYGSRFTCIF